MMIDVWAQACRVADELLIPQAERVDQLPLLPVSHLEALTNAGLYGRLEPTSIADLTELLAGACGNTFFVWAQHLGAQRVVRPADGERWGIAFAHLRRPENPPLAATATSGGYHLTGQAAWLTGVGLVDAFAIAAVCGPDIVWLRLVASRLAEEMVVEPLALAAMAATGTCRVTFDRARFGADDVLRVEPLAEWLVEDGPYTARPPYPALGVGRRALTLLAERDPETANVLADRLHVARQRSIDEPTHENRALAVLEVNRCTQAFIASVAGTAMLLDHPAQRLHREAAFYLVQAQTTAIRRATLIHLRT